MARGVRRAVRRRGIARSVPLARKALPGAAWQASGRCLGACRRPRARGAGRRQVQFVSKWRRPPAHPQPRRAAGPAAKHAMKPKSPPCLPHDRAAMLSRDRDRIVSNQRIRGRQRYATPFETKQWIFRATTPPAAPTAASASTPAVTAARCWPTTATSGSWPCRRCSTRSTVPARAPWWSTATRASSGSTGSTPHASALPTRATPSAATARRSSPTA